MSSCYLWALPVVPLLLFYFLTLCAVLVVLQALFCQVPAENVLTMHDVSNIWRVPLLMQSQVRPLLPMKDLLHYQVAVLVV
jgi:hypothetical protein